jgi:butyryl-CoA dehydrogenase
MAHFSRRNLDFTLFEVFKANELTQFPRFSAHDKETFGMCLDAVTDIAEQALIPAYADSDRNQPELVDGKVKVHQGVHDYYRMMSESGLIAAVFPEEYGGQQLPKIVDAGMMFILGSAHNSAIMFSELSLGCAHVLERFGNEQQKDLYLRNILSGKWTGTMCLTETQAGSSLSDVATTATPQGDGTYKIKGQKIFISGGDHDVTENIVHLVLARIDGAPKGTKGISLFIVPKHRPEQDGTYIDNDVESIGIYHKMGQKACPAMHLAFGEKEDCIGYLVGEEHKGLGYMFKMMNAARLGVGFAGVYMGSAAYYASLQYANERLQGRRISNKDATAPPIPIIEHADVRRLLFNQKAFFEGTMAMIMQCYYYFDMMYAAEDPAEKQRYSDLLELLTPVAKTFGSEGGFASVNDGLQVFGGYGYTEDFPLEQMVRDTRILTLYEGTTGIQSLALLGREIPRNNAQSIELWIKEVMPDIRKAQAVPELKKYADQLEKAVEQWKETTMYLLFVAMQGNVELFTADATLYMEMFGILNVSWQWLRQGLVAQEAMGKAGLAEEERNFYRSKVHTMQIYYHYELPKAKTLATRLTDETPLTLYCEGCEVLV